MKGQFGTVQFIDEKFSNFELAWYQLGYFGPFSSREDNQYSLTGYLKFLNNHLSIISSESRDNMLKCFI
jgi:hypothetical protein